MRPVSRHPASHGVLGLKQSARGTCGLCGRAGSLSRTHVPPQAAGNTGAVKRAFLVRDGGVTGPGRREVGGMYVYGLCARCNSRAGSDYDGAYARFAREVGLFLRPEIRAILVDRDAMPAVTLAPGLVARSVLCAMHALNPRLREKHPDLARSLLCGDSEVILPSDLRLWLALTEERTARIAGPVHSIRPFDMRESYAVIAEIFFRPLAWVLASERPIPPAPQLMQTQGWAEVSDWLGMGSERSSVDLRNLCRRLPRVTHPTHGDSGEDWLQLLAESITPIQVGFLPDLR